MIKENLSRSNKFFLLILMCFSLVLSNVSFAIWPVYLLEFRETWSLSNTDIGWISGSYFIGYLVVTPIYVGLTDKFDSKWIFIIASLSTSIACICLIFLAQGFWSTCFFWAIVGSGLAGTYMPGLQVLNSRLNNIERVKFTPWYTSSFGIANGVSFAIIGYIFVNYSWQFACYSAAITSTLASILVFLLVRNQKPKISESNTQRYFFDLRPAFRNSEALSYILSYGTHTYELFAYRAWIFGFIAWSSFNSTNSISLDLISFIIGIIMFLGMFASLMGAKVCLDYGRRKILILIGGSTFILSILCAISISIPLWYLIILLGIYHFFIMLDSGALTAGTVSASQDHERGAILAVHSIIGFGGGALAGPIIGFILDLAGGSENSIAWSFAFFTMGLGSMLVMLIQVRSKYLENG